MPHSAQKIKQLRAIYARYARSPRNIFASWPQRPIIDPPPHGKQHYSNLFVSRKGSADFTKQAWRKPNQASTMTLAQFTRRDVRSQANAHVERINNKLNLINNATPEQALKRRRVKAHLLMNKFRVMRHIQDEQ